MTDEELVNAYVEGRISRRMFVRRLVAGGVSLAAALTYAEALISPAAASSRDRKKSRDRERSHDDDHDRDERHRHHHKH